MQNSPKPQLLGGYVQPEQLQDVEQQASAPADSDQHTDRHGASYRADSYSYKLDTSADRRGFFACVTRGFQVFKLS
jgi:hypothetical protein